MLHAWRKRAAAESGKGGSGSGKKRKKRAAKAAAEAEAAAVFQRGAVAAAAASKKAKKVERAAKKANKVERAAKMAGAPARRERQPRAKPTSAELALRALPSTDKLASVAAAPVKAPATRSKRSRSKTPSKSTKRSKSEVREFKRAAMFAEGASRAETPAAKKRWAGRLAKLKSERMNLSPEQRRKQWRKQFKALTPEQLDERAAEAGLLAKDCAEMRRLCVAESDPLRASWWSQHARAALAVQNRAVTRGAGLDRSWVLGAAEETMRGLLPGDVVQMPRYAAAVQLRRDSGLFPATRAMLSSYQYGKLRGAVRQVCKRRGVHFHEGSEAYSTKQCCLCGTVLTKEQMPLGEKLFKCVKCPCEAHRDGHAAFNIVFMHIDTDLLLQFLDLSSQLGRRKRARGGDESRSKATSRRA